MQKLVLTSIFVVLVVAPIVAAREPNPRVGLRKMLLLTLAGILLYALAVIFIYPLFPG